MLQADGREESRIWQRNGGEPFFHPATQEKRREASSAPSAGQARRHRGRFRNGAGSRCRTARVATPENAPRLSQLFFFRPAPPTDAMRGHRSGFKAKGTTLVSVGAGTTPLGLPAAGERPGSATRAGALGDARPVRKRRGGSGIRRAGSVCRRPVPLPSPAAPPR